MTRATASLSAFLDDLPRRLAIWSAAIAVTGAVGATLLALWGRG